MKAFKPTLILADYSLPKFDALQALALRNKNAPLTPFIIVTGSISEEIAVECMKQGADDYLLKDRLARLGEAVRHSLTNRRLKTEKMAAEESLRANELLYRTFIDSSTDMAFLKDDQIPAPCWPTRRCAAFTKNRKMRSSAKRDFELMDKSAAAMCRQSDEQVHGPKTGSISARKRSAAELSKPANSRYRLADGRIGIGGYIRDISERKRTQEQIEQAARKWTTTFDAIKDGIALLAVDQTIMQANQAFADLVNKPFKEIIGKKCYELMHPNRQPDPHCPFAKMQKSKKRESMEQTIDNRVFAVIVDPITNAAGTITGATHILNDITERRRVEELLRESEKKFRDLAELLPQTVFETDLQGRLTFVNRSAYNILGYDENDFRNGLQIWQMLILGDRERATEEYTQSSSRRTRRKQRVHLAHAGDGTTFLSTSIRRPSSWLKGQPRGYPRHPDRHNRAQAGVEEALRESEEQYRDLVEKGEHSNCC